MVLLFLEERYNVSFLTRTVQSSLESFATRGDGNRPLDHFIQHDSTDGLVSAFRDRLMKPLSPTLVNVAQMSALQPYASSSVALFEGDLRGFMRFQPMPDAFDVRSGVMKPLGPDVGPLNCSLADVLVGKPSTNSTTGAKGMQLVLQHLGSLANIIGQLGLTHGSVMRSHSDFPLCFYADGDAKPMDPHHSFCLLYIQLVQAREVMMLKLESYDSYTVIDNASADYQQYRSLIGRLVLCDIVTNLIEMYAVCVMDPFLSSTDSSFYDESVESEFLTFPASSNLTTVGRVFNDCISNWSVLSSLDLQTQQHTPPDPLHMQLPQQYTQQVGGTGVWNRIEETKRFTPGSPPPGTIAYYLKAICSKAFLLGEPGVPNKVDGRTIQPLISAGFVKSSMVVLRRRSILAECDRYLFNALSYRGGYSLFVLGQENNTLSAFTSAVSHSHMKKRSMPSFARWTLLSEESKGAVFWQFHRQNSLNFTLILLGAAMLSKEGNPAPTHAPTFEDVFSQKKTEGFSDAVLSLGREIAIPTNDGFQNGIFTSAHVANSSALIALTVRNTQFSLLASTALAELDPQHQLLGSLDLSLLPCAGTSLSPIEAHLYRNLFIPDHIYTVSAVSKHLAFLKYTPAPVLSQQLTKVVVSRQSDACRVSITEHTEAHIDLPPNTFVFPRGGRPPLLLCANPRARGSNDTIPKSLSNLVTSDRELSLLLHRTRLSLHASVAPNGIDKACFQYYHNWRSVKGNDSIVVTDWSSYLNNPKNSCGLTDINNQPVLVAPYDNFPHVFQKDLFTTVPLQSHHSALLYRVSDHHAHVDNTRYIIGEEVHKTNLGGVYKAKRHVPPQFLYSNALQLSHVSWPCAEYLLDTDKRQFGIVLSHFMGTDSVAEESPATPSAAATMHRAPRRSVGTHTLSVTFVLGADDAKFVSTITVGAHDIYRNQGIANTVVEYSYDALTFLPFCTITELDDCPRTYELGNIRGARYWRFTRHDAANLAIGCLCFGQIVALKRSRRSKLQSNKCGDDPRRECEYYCFLRGNANTPTVLALHDNDQFDPTWHCIVSQFLAGQDVYHLLSRNRDPKNLVMIPEDDVALLFTQVVLAVYFMHHVKQVAHQDQKPANILLSSNYKRAYVTDFGVARRIVPKYVTYHDSQLHDLGENPYLRELLAANDGHKKIPSFEEALPTTHGTLNAQEFYVQLPQDMETTNAASNVMSDKVHAPSPVVPNSASASYSTRANGVDIIDGEAAEPIHLTVGVAGTRDYMSPELIKLHRQRVSATRYSRCKYITQTERWCEEMSLHNSPYCKEHTRVVYGYDARKADVFSLGVILFTMLTKVPPYMNFADDNNAHWVQLKRHGVAHMIKEYSKQHPSIKVSAEAIDLMQCMVIDNPDERYYIEDVVQHPWIQRNLQILKSQDMDTYAHLT